MREPTGKKVTILMVCLAVVAVWFLKPDPRPGPIGMESGALRGCPDSPNCVCSLASDADHAVEAFRLSIPWPQARGKVVELVSGVRGFTIVRSEPDYLHIACRTLLMRYVDDMELHWDSASGLLQVRSASRIGYSDLGANRRRVEALRERFRSAGLLKP